MQCNQNLGRRMESETRWSPVCDGVASFWARNETTCFAFRVRSVERFIKGDTSAAWSKKLSGQTCVGGQWITVLHVQPVPLCSTLFTRIQDVTFLGWPFISNLIWQRYEVRSAPAADSVLHGRRGLVRKWKAMTMVIFKSHRVTHLVLITVKHW